ncbi:MAG: thiamine phosphate synthase [Oscillospiraceae bacterium]
MMKKVDYTLYLCTDRELMSSDTIEQSVEQALKGGVTVVQLREKNCSGREFFDLAVRVKKITDSYNVPLIINDRADIALAADCAGVHVGQSDMPCKELRKIMGDKLIGVSTATVAEALKAQADGADYIGVGAMHPTGTKTNTRPVTKETLAEIRAAVDIPMVIIGGMNKTTLGEFKGMGVDGIAVVSAIVSQPDITAAAKELYRLWTE